MTGKRLFDLFFSLTAILVLLIPGLILAIIIIAGSRGGAFYRQVRVGKNQKPFRLLKFRTMFTGSDSKGLLTIGSADSRVTRTGKFLRKTKLDELPQLLNILAGDMSFVGPRPALYNQHDLIELRTKRGVHKIVPGLTGWAQVNGRDELPIPEKVALDVEYLQRRSFWFDCTIIWKTLVKVLQRDGVSH